ncbi:energy transducer TonB [Pedobacter glucosidilyticus]|uniref:energy transducer TonB n=1 Tax=Pedobacter glucosidilyticus TaxID=1122941 RepID=UPI000420AB8A|nr:energy transducer TonB [Pedobacter glucosidilyticus]
MLYSKFNLNKIEWLNLIFDGRNQVYGAYELRKNSGNYLAKALFIASFGFAALIIGPSAYYFYKQTTVDVSPNDIPKKDDEKLYRVHKIELPPKTLNSAKAGTQVTTPKEAAQKEIKYTSFKPTPDDLVAKEAPTLEELETGIISSVDKAGEAGGLNATHTEGTNGTLDAGTTTDSGNEYLVSAEEMPEFPGGMTAWAKYLNRNLQYPAVARENEIQGRVTVSFVVERNGEITNIKVLRGIGAGCDEEAIRVIKKSPLWKPGKQNGKAVRVSYVIPIVFRLD